MNLDQLGGLLDQLAQAFQAVRDAAGSGSTEVVAAAEQKLQQADLAYSQWLSNLPVPGGLGPGSAGRNLVLLFNPLLKDQFDRLDAARAQVQQMIDSGQIPPALRATAQSAVDTVGQTTTAPAGVAGAVPPMQDWIQFLVWLGALVVLFLVLTALAEAGFEREAYAMAGLLIFGALLFMGPTAIANAKTLIATPALPGTPSSSHLM